MLWLLAELSILACDLPDVLGSALALRLLFGMSLLTGIAVTAFDTLIVLGLKGKGFREPISFACCPPHPRGSEFRRPG